MALLSRPFLAVPSVIHINPPGLVEAGIQGLLIDLDNTLMLPHGVAGHGVLTDAIHEWLTLAREANLQLICVTNCKNATYCQTVEMVLGFPVIHKAKKPFGSGLRLAMAYLDLPARAVAVVGDRPTTDGWGAAMLGCHYILTSPLRLDEPWHYRALRAVERQLVGKPHVKVSA